MIANNMNQYFKVDSKNSYHVVVFDIARAFNDGAIGEKFTGKLGIGQVVSAAGTVGPKLHANTIEMSVEPIGDGTYAINDYETSEHGSFDIAVTAAKSALIAAFN